MDSWNSRRCSRRSDLPFFAVKGLLWASPAASLTSTAVAARLAVADDVDVAKVVEVRRDGELRRAVTVMLPRDAGNAAFAQGTVLVDAATDQPVLPPFHRPKGWSALSALIALPEPARPMLRRESLARERIR